MSLATWEFWLTSFVVTATPGTGAIFTIAAGLARGPKAALVAAVGCTLGIVPHLLLALSGAAALLAASPVAFGIVKWLGVGYLLYLAWGIWRQTGVTALGATETDTRTSALATIRSAVLINLLNPKLTVFFFVFLPLFVDPDTGALWQMATLGAAFMALTVVIFALYGFGAAWLRRYIIGKPAAMRWINRGFAVSFVALAVLLALTN